MRTLLLALLVLTCCAGAAHAMDMADSAFYLQGILSIPLGEFGDVAGTGFGGAIGLRVPQDDRLAFRGEVGYLAFLAKDSAIFSNSIKHKWTQIPIVALAEFQLNPDSPIYVLGGAGYHISRLTLDPDVPGLDTSNGDLGITLGAGLRASERFAGEFRYNLISDASQLIVGIVYRF
jgi:hypothetical protein